MSGQEVCIIVIPNDFPKNDDEDHDINVNQEQETSQGTSGDGKGQSKESEKSNDDSSPMTVRPTNDQRPQKVRKRNSTTPSSSDANHSEEYPCEQCEQSLASRFLHHTIPKLNLRDTIWIPTNDNKSLFILCYTQLGPQSDGILNELRQAEIGIRAGTKVFVVPLSCALGIEQVAKKQKTIDVSDATKNKDTEEDSEDEDENADFSNDRPSHVFIKSIRARLTVQKIIGSIRNKSIFTFDYVFFCILASMISGLGLLEDNTVILVASMLVSPLMAPIMGFLIGVRIREKKLWVAGLVSESAGIIISVLTGFVLGLCTTWSETKWGSSESFPTNEMRTRGDYRRLWSGALIALPSGAAAALSILGGNFGSLVGVAISASLLPPAVNSGLLFSYSILATSNSHIGVHSSKEGNGTETFDSLETLVNCTKYVDNDYLPLYSCNMAREAAQLAIYSLVVTLINIACICMTALMVLLIKKVAPVISDDEVVKLWHSDLKEVGVGSDKKSNKKVKGRNTNE